MSKHSSFKAPQQSLKSSWKGIESFKMNKTRKSETICSFSKGGRKNITVKHEGSYIAGGNKSNYQY